MRLRDFAEYLGWLDAVVVLRLQDKHGRLCVLDGGFEHFIERIVTPRLRRWRKGDEGSRTQSLLGCQEGLNASQGTSRHHKASRGSTSG